MIGAVVGDIAGSRFEFFNQKSKEFVLLATAEEVEWGPPSSFTVGVFRGRGPQYDFDWRGFRYDWRDLRRRHRVVLRCSSEIRAKAMTFLPQHLSHVLSRAEAVSEEI